MLSSTSCSNSVILRSLLCSVLSQFCCGFLHLEMPRVTANCCKEKRLIRPLQAVVFFRQHTGLLFYSRSFPSCRRGAMCLPPPWPQSKPADLLSLPRWLVAPLSGDQQRQVLSHEEQFSVKKAWHTPAYHLTSRGIRVFCSSLECSYGLCNQSCVWQRDVLA